jgi:hypothetical protein
MEKQIPEDEKVVVERIRKRRRTTSSIASAAHAVDTPALATIASDLPTKSISWIGINEDTRDRIPLRSAIRRTHPDEATKAVGEADLALGRLKGGDDGTTGEEAGDEIGTVAGAVESEIIEDLGAGDQAADVVEGFQRPEMAVCAAEGGFWEDGEVGQGV